jgi:2-dehydro-3-deoxygalactonokinase
VTPHAPSPELIAVDWGTSRLRAYLLGPRGDVLGKVESEDGIGPLGGAGHADAFERMCGPWRAAHPATPVLMAGMVGSRNGWREAPYVAVPTSVAELAANTVEVALAGGGHARIAPGLLKRGPARSDVVRGEEMRALGAARPGAFSLLCLPGTHAKWLSVDHDRLSDFRTFVTGELYGLIVEQSFIGSLGRPGEDDPDAFEAGLAAADEPDGLTSVLFAARANVLDGRLAPEGVADYVSGCLIGTEVRHALASAPTREITLVAGGEHAWRYETAIRRAGALVTLVDTEAAFLAGMRRVAAGMARA